MMRYGHDNLAARYFTITFVEIRTRLYPCDFSPQSTAQPPPLVMNILKLAPKYLLVIVDANKTSMPMRNGRILLNLMRVLNLRLRDDATASFRSSLKSWQDN